MRAMLLRSAYLKLEAAESLAGRGLFEASLLHLASALRLLISALLDLVGLEPHSCSLAGSLSLIVRRWRSLGLQAWSERLLEISKRYRAILVCLDSLQHSGVATPGCGPPEELYRGGIQVFQELLGIYRDLAGGR